MIVEAETEGNTTNSAEIDPEAKNCLKTPF